MMLLLVMLATVSMAQQTVVKGAVTDIRTHETMPAVTVSIDGTAIGGSTDIHGNYRINTDGNYTRIKVSFIGYKTIYKDITPGIAQTINVAMSEDRRELSEVVIKSGKKTRYKNRDNPAVELIRKVIAHKDQNRLENFNYAEYQQYERMIFSLSDLSEKFKNKRMFKNYQFLFMEQDSDAIGGKNLLPVYGKRRGFRTTTFENRLM